MSLRHVLSQQLLPQMAYPFSQLSGVPLEVSSTQLRTEAARRAVNGMKNGCCFTDLIIFVFSQ